MKQGKSKDCPVMRNHQVGQASTDVGLIGGTSVHWFSDALPNMQNVISAGRTEMATQKLSPAERIKIASEWRQHLVLQYENRCIYWSLRFASRAKLNVLCIIADSMGKVR